MTPHIDKIEAAMQDFDDGFPCFDQSDEAQEAHENLRSFIRTALQSYGEQMFEEGKKNPDVSVAAVYGFEAGRMSAIEECIACVPKEKEQLNKDDPDNYGACYAIAGFNNCRELTLAALQSLISSNKQV